MTKDAGNAGRLWTRSFIVLTLGAFLLFLSLQMLLSPLPSYVKNTFDPGSFVISLVTSLFALAAIASRFGTAWLLRRAGRNTILFIGLGLAAASTALYGEAASIGMLLLLRVLFGIGFGMASTVLPTIVTQIIPPSRLGEGVGYFGLSTSIAMSLGPMIGLSIMGSFGFGTLSLSGGAAALIIIPLLLALRAIPPQPSTAKPSLSAAADPRAAELRSGSIWMPAALNALMAVTYGSVLSYIVLFGEERHLANVGLFFLFNAVTVLLVRPISGRLFDRHGPAVVLIPGAVVLMASLTLLSYSQHMGLLIVSALLYGLGFGSIQPSAQAWMLRSTPRERHASANSLFYNSTDFGVACGSMVLGAAASALGYAAMYRFSAGVMGLFLVAYLIYWTASKRNSRLKASAQ